MTAPVSNQAICDAFGCGMPAVGSTTGIEVDAAGRTAVPKVNFCARHPNWPHSDDAKVFAAISTVYKARA
jgi:hypothetical protein